MSNKILLLISSQYRIVHSCTIKNKSVHKLVCVCVDNLCIHIQDVNELLVITTVQFFPSCTLYISGCLSVH